MSKTVVVLFSILALAIADPIRHDNPVKPIRLVRSVRPEDVPHGVEPSISGGPADQDRLARYSPVMSNQYHLFTRQNPTISFPLLIFNNALLTTSTYDVTRRTVFLIHGNDGNSTSNFVMTMVPAILAASDVNVIVLDWTEGTELGVAGAVLSANSVADFVLWLMEAAEGYHEDYHLIGLGVGGQHAAITSRFAGSLGHVTALDPPTWRDVDERIRFTDAMFIEVVFTNTDGVLTDEPYGRVDFYPNGGKDMPGCGGDWACNHARSYFYMAESIVSGGFTGRQCASMEHALVGNCDLTGILQMGAPYASYIARGIFYLETNASPPFSQG